MAAGAKQKAIGFFRREPVLVISFVCAAASMAFVPPSEAYGAYFDWKVLSLLFCLMAVVAGLQQCGLFQVLSLVPGTSRSGATILGGILMGCSRAAASEFSFFLAIPTMAGASLIKVLKFGLSFTSEELLILGIGCVSAFIVSIIAIKTFIGYIKQHSFTAFGWYRIILGALVAVYFLLK